MNNECRQHGTSTFPAQQNFCLKASSIQTAKTQKECKYCGGKLLKLNTSQNQNFWIQVHNFKILWEFRSGFSSGVRDGSWSQNLLPCLNIQFSMHVTDHNYYSSYRAVIHRQMKTVHTNWEAGFTWRIQPRRWCDWWFGIGRLITPNNMGLARCAGFNTSWKSLSAL